MEGIDILESSLSRSEFWATIACGAVALGLLIEYGAEFKHAAAKRSVKLLPLGALLVTLGVLAEFIFQVRTSILIAEVRGIQDQHVASANERAAEAEKAAAEAKLALAKMNAPRKLTPDQADALVEQLRQQAGKHFWIVTQRSSKSRFGEQIDLGKQLAQVFTSAGWTRTSQFKLNSLDGETPEFTEVSDRGCLVEGGQPALIKFVRDNLAAVNVQCDAAENPEYRPDFVFIEIGLR